MADFDLEDIKDRLDAIDAELGNVVGSATLIIQRNSLAIQMKGIGRSMPEDIAVGVTFEEVFRRAKDQMPEIVEKDDRRRMSMMASTIMRLSNANGGVDRDALMDRGFTEGDIARYGKAAFAEAARVAANGRAGFWFEKGVA